MGICRAHLAISGVTSYTGGQGAGAGAGAGAGGSGQVGRTDKVPTVRRCQSSMGVMNVLCLNYRQLSLD